MPDDLLETFDAVIAEGGDTEQPDVLSRNATVHQGSDEVEDTDVGEVFESDDTDSDNVVEGESDSEDIVESDDATDDGFDFDSIKDKTVSVTVGGETFDVPLNELRNGYMRQADYTRKTQQVAQIAEMARWAHEMQEALQTNPAATIRYLQEAMGVSLDESPSDPWEDIDPEIRPIVSELQATKQQLAELQAKSYEAEQARVQMEVRAELDQMRSKYQDFDPQVILPIAIEEGLTMEKAYKLWRADQLEHESAAKRAAREKAEKAAVEREKARKASSKVSKGSSNVAASSDDSWKKFDSFEQIFAYEVEKTKA